MWATPSARVTRQWSDVRIDLYQQCFNDIWLRRIGSFNVCVPRVHPPLSPRTTVRAGETERDVHSRLVQSCIRRGAEWVHGILNSHRNTVAYGGEGDMVFQPGDIIRNDYVAYVQGYPGHQSRTVVIGEPSDEQQQTYRLMRNIYRQTIDQCRVGIKASAIHAFAAQQFRQHGYSARVSLVGHSVGPWWHQQEPYLIPTCHQELEAGMVLALEPHVGYWHLQDLIEITSDGPHLLSDRFTTDDMFVVE